MAKDETPLIAIKPGNKVTVKRIHGGLNMKIRLNEMGITCNSEINVVRNDGWGPVIISLSMTRLAIGRQMANKILVEKKN
ncbi:MAG: FeoA family protein [Clostridia bacterium]|nr:FeoA family protein [Clostridia bacterium]MDD4047820.1 FeoA family protein [Clostridia bacterium]